MEEDTIRITFSCGLDLRNRLTNQATQEGIARSQLIVELLETALGPGDGEGGMDRSPAINRLLFDMQERVGELETWRKAILGWTKSTDENTSNLETTIAELLNAQITDTGGTKPKRTKKKGIPLPKKP